MASFPMRRAVRLIFSRALVSLAVLVSAAAGAAEPRQLLVLEDQKKPSPRGILEALRIQLAGSATVREIRLAAPDEGRAAEELVRGHAAMALWLDERGALPAWRVLEAAPGSRPIELGFLASPETPELDRNLALKVSVLLEEEPDPLSRDFRARASTTTRAFAELAASASTGGAPRLWLPSVGLAAGPRWERAAGMLEAYGNFALRANVQVQARAGETDVSLVYVGAGVRALAWHAPFAVGPSLELGVEILHARGVAADGRVGSAELRAPTSRFGVQARWLVVPYFELCAGVGADLWLTRERLKVSGSPTLDFGRVRGSGVLSGVLVFP